MENIGFEPILKVCRTLVLPLTLIPLNSTCSSAKKMLLFILEFRSYVSSCSFECLFANWTYQRDVYPKGPDLQSGKAQPTAPSDPDNIGRESNPLRPYAQAPYLHTLAQEQKI